MIQELTKILSGNKDLNSAQMHQAMEEIMTGKVATPEIISFLTTLSKRGETVEELTAAAEVMRRFAIKINSSHEIILDTCGTGGDNRGVFNISTTAAFVVSGAGIVVAKHGNRSVSSKSGSADILEALGVNIHMGPDEIAKCLDQVGIAFLFAQDFHPAMKYAMPARKQIGSRTIFNLLGPLTNPVGATHQLIGVYDSRWLEPLALVMKNLMAKRSIIVHGLDGLDEVTITDETQVVEQDAENIKKYQVKPEDFGFQRASLSDLSGGSANDNAEILLDILKGKSGPMRDIVVLNAAFAIYIAGKAYSLEEAIDYAELSINSKSALEKFRLFKEYSKQ